MSEVLVRTFLALEDASNRFQRRMAGLQLDRAKQPSCGSLEDDLESDNRVSQVAGLQHAGYPGLVRTEQRHWTKVRCDTRFDAAKNGFEQCRVGSLVPLLNPQLVAQTMIGTPPRLCSDAAHRQGLSASEHYAKFRELRVSPYLAADFTHKALEQHACDPSNEHSVRHASCGRTCMADGPCISLIIPALNERLALPRTLARVSGETADREVIVVDGGSNDGTRDIAAEHPGVRVITATTGRALQMNAGARSASGTWLLFLHADTLIPRGALSRISSLACEAGAFRHAFSGNDWRLRAVSWLHNQRCRLDRLFFGDQAIFVRSELFWRLGGFPEVPILEDVLFSEKLRSATRPVLLDDYVVTDARKFIAKGILRTTARAFLILLRHELRLPVRSTVFFEEVR